MTESKVKLLHSREPSLTGPNSLSTGNDNLSEIGGDQFGNREYSTDVIYSSSDKDKVNLMTPGDEKVMDYRHISQEDLFEANQR